MDKELKDTDTRNWVKTCLALHSLKEGILPFMKDKCDEQYLNDINFLKHLFGLADFTCKLCKFEELKPFHSHPTLCKYAHVKSYCACKGKHKKECPEKGCCGKLYDIIKDLHVKNDPKWSNTNCELWSDKLRGAWERMKCFIHTPGYKEKEDISDADITAFVQICTNNELLKRAFGADLDCLEQIRDIRNAVCHSGTMNVSPGDFLKYVKVMEDTLKLNIFDDYPSAKVELEKLHNLENDSTNVTIEDELTSREETLLAIRELKKLLEHQVTTDDLREEIANLKTVEDTHKRILEVRFIEIEKHMLKLQEEHMRNKTRLDKHKAILNNINKVVVSLDAKVNQLSVDMQEGFKKTLGQNEKILQDLAILKQLFERSLHSTTPITVTIPDSKLVVNIRISQGEELVSDELVKSMNGIRHGVPLTELQQRLQTAVQQVFTGGVELKKVKNECMALYIGFSTFKSWLEFLHKYLTGEIAKSFLPVQEHLRTYLGCEDLELSVDVYEEDFELCVQSILYQLETNTMTAMAQGAKEDTVLTTVHTLQLSHDVTSEKPSGRYVAQTEVLKDYIQPPVNQQKYVESETTYSDKLLVTGMHPKTRECHLEEFLLDYTGCHMKLGSMVVHASRTDTAMVTFDRDIDYQHVADKCSSHLLKGCKLRFSSVQKPKCVILSKLKETVNKEMVLAYFNRNGPVVQKVDMLDRNNSCCVINFYKEEDADEALCKEHAFDGETVDIHRYFACIERTEPENMLSKRIGNATVCLSRGDWSEMNFDEIAESESGSLLLPPIVTSNTKINQGGRYCHAKCLSSKCRNPGTMCRFAGDCGFKSLAFIIDGSEHTIRSLLKSLWSYPRGFGKTLDKIYICSTRSAVLEELGALLSVESLRKPEDKYKTLGSLWKPEDKYKTFGSLWKPEDKYKTFGSLWKPEDEYKTFGYEQEVSKRREGDDMTIYPSAGKHRIADADEKGIRRISESIHTVSVDDDDLLSIRSADDDDLLSIRSADDDDLLSIRSGLPCFMRKLELGRSEDKYKLHKIRSVAGKEGSKTEHEETREQIKDSPQL